MLNRSAEASQGRVVVVASLGYKMGIKTIQFDDMNWNNYHQNKTYSQSKLAQMMFAYELQDRLSAANSDVEVYVCPVEVVDYREMLERMGTGHLVSAQRLLRSSLGRRCWLGHAHT